MYDSLMNRECYEVKSPEEEWKNCILKIRNKRYTADHCRTSLSLGHL